MREIRPSGLEGGGAVTPLSLPLSNEGGAAAALWRANWLDQSRDRQREGSGFFPPGSGPAPSVPPLLLCQRNGPPAEAHRGHAQGESRLAVVGRMVGDHRRRAGRRMAAARETASGPFLRERE